MGDNKIQRVLDLLKRAHGELAPLKIWDYDKDAYLVYVQEPGIKPEDNFNDPFYLVYKNADAVIRHSSGEDFMKFFRVTDSAPIWTAG